jgi:dienelactone hydrolase
MRKLSLHRPVSLTGALLASLIVHLCAPVYADSGDSPDIQYGRFSIKATVAELVDPETMESMSKLLDGDKEITWQMYVPKSYDPSKPAGLLVYVSPTPQGGMPIGWKPVFDEENLILISADESGNKTPTKTRIRLAALAPYVAAEHYRIDRGRIYVSGFSGGGKVASIASIQFANLFSGAIYICGVEFWPKFAPALLTLAKTHRYVFLTGSNDFNRQSTRKIYARYERAGIADINLITVPGMAHSMPGEAHFREAMHFLDNVQPVETR